MSNNNLNDLKKNFYGISYHLIRKGLMLLGISFEKIYFNNNKKIIINNLSEKEKNFLFNYFKNKFLIDSELKDKIFIDIRKMKLLKMYKGLRHYYSLPVNGQRTKTNAKTNKKKIIKNINKKKK